MTPNLKRKHQKSFDAQVDEKGPYPYETNDSRLDP